MKAWRRKQIQTVVDMETGELFEYLKLLTHLRFNKAWSMSVANVFGRLAQGIGDWVNGMDTIHIIKKSELPADQWRDITYIKFVCTVCTEKKEPNRMQATLAGNLINYPDDVGTPTAGQQRCSPQCCRDHTGVDVFSGQSHIGGTIHQCVHSC